LILQVNTSVTTTVQLMADMEQEGIVAQPGSYSENALILPEFHGAVSKLPGFAQGHFQIQDEGAQLIALLLTPIIANGRYLDGCAGVGGKTSCLIQLSTTTQATIDAVEPDPQRLQKFRANMLRLHPDAPVILYDIDLQRFAQNCDSRFDGILIDAPCSGTGVIGRHPDIRWNRQEHELARYQQNQLALLEQASGLLAPNGILVYATCSIEPEENEKVIALFLDHHPDFVSEDCAPLLPPPARELVRDGFFAPLPRSTIDGFFGARLRHGEKGLPVTKS
jgi:16S rRNA (cytosine967-C5)-methyltransferase